MPLAYILCGQISLMKRKDPDNRATSNISGTLPYAILSTIITNAFLAAIDFETLPLALVQKTLTPFTVLAVDRVSFLALVTQDIKMHPGPSGTSKCFFPKVKCVSR